MSRQISAKMLRRKMRQPVAVGSMAENQHHAKLAKIQISTL